MLQLQHPQFLWAFLILFPLIFLFILVLKWKKKVQNQLGEAAFIQQLINNHSSKKYFLKITLVLAAIALLLIAIIGLRKPEKNKNAIAFGLDIMIALDVSKSMLSADVKPSRLDKAKQFIYQLTDKLQNNQIGLVVFAGEAFLQLPLTADAGVSKIFISNANTDLVNLQGTNISAALNLCKNSLDTKHKRSKAIILITDGENHDEQINQSIEQLNQQGIIVYTVGLGSKEGAPIVEAGTNDYKRDTNGETVITKLDETLLIEIATKTNGKYFHFSDEKNISNEVLTAINQLEKNPIQTAGIGVKYQLFYGIFLAIAIVILVAEVFIKERKTIKF